MQVIWFKRDLRAVDHAALHGAVNHARAHKHPLLALYILEPELWRQPDMSGRHYAFLTECLHDLYRELKARGITLCVKTGAAVSVLDDLNATHKIHGLWSHQETWNGWTYQRDRAVKKWCQLHNIDWQEPQQFGVVRRLASRDLWAREWHRTMLTPAPSDLEGPPPIHPQGMLTASDRLPEPSELKLTPDPCPERPHGGRQAGLKILDSFLQDRGQHYRRQMSSPLTAFDACSRLSPYLAFGAVSIREAFRTSLERRQALDEMPTKDRPKGWIGSLKAFESRLRWHCHFIQKLEDEPRLEFENLHSAYDTLRTEALDRKKFDAWAQGCTGFPMIDACMRALIQTGWLNFRMRAMLMSFASYHLWLHWRDPALHLARLFVDYEPGIHYSQCQMQSGTTGINAMRIYNPEKQSREQDPDGAFLRKWVPEIAGLPDHLIHTPWVNLARTDNYPAPIVDEKKARKAAAQALYGLRRTAGHRSESGQIVVKHGSRRRPSSPRRSGRRNMPEQQELDL
ncbi:MAG: FAD-binding domain-containing protein [Parvibaculales bacterium]